MDSNFWLGFNDAAVEGQWTWSSGESATYTNWAPGEPNNDGGWARNEDYCLFLTPNGGGLWNDAPNTLVQPGIIEITVAAPSQATTYGAGCGTPPLGFFPTANPVIGTTAGALITNAPTLAAGVTMGWSDTHVNGLPILPYDLAALGLPGCNLLHSNDAFGLPTAPLTASTLQFDFAIPFSPSLLSAHVYTQAFAFAPGVNAAQVVVSNGVDWLIGNQ